MLKNIALVLTGMGIMFGICLGFRTFEMNTYNEEMSKLIDQCEETVEKCIDQVEKYQIELDECYTRVNELEEGIWNHMNHKAYEITISRNNETHTWRKDDDGFFSGSHHTVVY